MRKGECQTTSDVGRLLQSFDVMRGMLCHVNVDLVTEGKPQRHARPGRDASGNGGGTAAGMGMPGTPPAGPWRVPYVLLCRLRGRTSVLRVDSGRRSACRGKAAMRRDEERLGGGGVMGRGGSRNRDATSPRGFHRQEKFFAGRSPPSPPSLSHACTGSLGMALPSLIRRRPPFACVAGGGVPCPVSAM